MDIKKVLTLIESAEQSKQSLTEGKNMAQDMVMQHFTKQEIKTPIKNPVSKLNEYFKIVDNEMLTAIKEEQEAKRVEVKKIVNNVLQRLDENKKIPASKPRNFVAKNQKTGGAGAHKDKKKAEKQGDVKHKGKEMDLAEMHRRDSYERDYDSSIAGMDGSDHREFKRQELQHELGHERNNIAIAINGKTWKVVLGRGYADSPEEWKYLQHMKDWAERKSASSGKKWTVHLTGADPTNESTQLNEKAVSKAQQKFMGMVHAAQKGEKPASKEVAKVAKGMSKKSAKDFASTKHKGLPEKKNKKTDEGLKDPKDNPCWKGYKPVGTKKKAGKTVPNCVPKESIEVGSKVQVYSNVLKKPMIGTVIRLNENRAYVQYNNTKIVMGHPLNEVAAAPAATAATKVAGATGGKLASRFIPGVGLAVSGYDAYDRAKKGDYVGAALSGAAGLTSLIPGIGTAASIGLTGAQLARDYNKKTGAFAPDDAAQPAQKYPTTPQEIKAFQQANGLVPDGIIGPKTKAALDKAGIKQQAPQQAQQPGFQPAAAARAVAPAAAAVAKQVITK